MPYFLVERETGRGKGNRIMWDTLCAAGCPSQASVSPQSSWGACGKQSRGADQVGLR